MNIRFFYLIKLKFINTSLFMEFIYTTYACTYRTILHILYICTLINKFILILYNSKPRLKKIKYPGRKII